MEASQSEGKGETECAGPSEGVPAETRQLAKPLHQSWGAFQGRNEHKNNREFKSLSKLSHCKAVFAFLRVCHTGAHQSRVKQEEKCFFPYKCSLLP